MLDWLQLTLTGLSLALAVLAGVYVVLDRLTDRWVLALAGLLGVGTVLQLVLGVVALVGTDRAVSTATFVGYLVGVALVPPLATFWALGERSRAGTAVWIVAGLVIPFLELRLDQIWAGPGG